MTNFETLLSQSMQNFREGSIVRGRIIERRPREVMVDIGVHAWDVAGILPVVEEAGGRMTGWSGQFDLHAPDVVASNGKLHDKVLAILNGKKP